MDDLLITIRHFYRAYLNWVETEDNPLCFEKSTGLCHNLIRFCRWEPDARRLLLADRQEQMFRDAGLDVDYPFESKDSYLIRTDKRQVKSRIDWVRKWASDE